MTRARQGSRNTSRMKSQSLLALPWMGGPFTTMDTWVPLQVKIFIKMSNLILQYIKFFLDYITPSWERQALVLGCVPFAERHTSFNIAEWMVKELDDWQMTPITEMIVSDTASNQMGVFNDDLVPHLPPHFKPARCCCHVLQLCIKDCILEKPHISRLIKDCRWTIINVSVISQNLGTFAPMQIYPSTFAMISAMFSRDWTQKPLCWCSSEDR